MGIDGIGKGGGAPKAPDASGDVGKLEKATKTGAVDKPFSLELDRTKEAAQVEQAGAVAEASPLAQLRAGEIDVDRYLDLKVDEATKPLAGLSPAELADIKQVLRDQLATDPGLVDLVRTATGKTPSPPEDT